MDPPTQRGSSIVFNRGQSGTAIVKRRPVRNGHSDKKASNKTEDLPS